MKRIFDIFVSLFGLLLITPVLLIFMYLVYRQGRHMPLYMASRVGKDGVVFKMVKLRSMTTGSDSSGVDSTASNDSRITPIGNTIRKYKLDEFTQLWNVLIGDMSFVGPRPNVKRGTELYTDIEKKLLSVIPGITDFSSIVFSDEGEILKNREDPDLAYNQLIRPWKSRLGLVYVENHSIWLDLKIIFFTVVAIASKQTAIKWVAYQLKLMGVSPEIISASKRENDLYPFPPPGSDDIFVSR